MRLIVLQELKENLHIFVRRLTVRARKLADQKVGNYHPGLIFLFLSISINCLCLHRSGRLNLCVIWLMPGLTGALGGWV